MKNKRITIKEKPRHDQQHQALLGKYEEDDFPKNIKTISIVLSSILILVGLGSCCVLLWNRIEWGFQEWIHEAMFFNFWNGTYIVLSGMFLLIFTCSLQIWSLQKMSVPGLAATCVFHGITSILLLVGAVAMVADAVIVEEEWLEEEIYRLMDPISNNNPYLRDYFLCNMYRIVNCCGANGYLDYRDRYAISPPEECRRHGINNMGGSYYEDGCAEKFSIWVKIWAGCTAFVVAIVFSIEILLMVWSYRIIKLLKRRHKELYFLHNSSNGHRNHLKSSGKMKTGMPPSSFSYKIKSTSKNNSHAKEESAPLKALPSTPEDKNVFETDGIKTKSEFESSRNVNIISEEKTHFGQVVNGNIQPTNNFSGNFGPTVQAEQDNDFAPKVPKRMSSIRTKSNSALNREIPSPPIPEHKDMSHVSQGFRKPLPTVENQISVSNSINSNITEQWKEQSISTKRLNDSTSLNDTSSEVIDIDEAIGVPKVSFKLPHENFKKSLNDAPSYLERDHWTGTSPFHNRNWKDNPRPNSPSRHQYQEIGEPLRKEFQFDKVMHPTKEKGQWSSTDDTSLNGIESDATSTPRIQSPLRPSRQATFLGQPIELKKLNIQKASDYDTNHISYGYENVLPLSKLPVSPSGSSTAPSSIYTTTSEEDEFDLDSELGPNSKFQRRVKTEQKDMPLVVFPKRKKSSSRSFQFSLPKKRFQRVLDSDPRHFFSRSMSSLNGTNSENQNSQQSQTRTQRGRNMGNFRHKQNQPAPPKLDSRSRTRHAPVQKNDIDITFDENDEDEYIRNKKNSTSPSLPNLTESYTYEKNITSTKITETRI